MPDTDAAAKRPRRKSRRAYVLEDQIGFILRQASQRYAVLFAERMVDELTPTQFAALVKLHTGGVVSQNRLGRLTAMDAATIKGVIDRLSARGYIEADVDPADARLRLLTLSARGREVVARALPPAEAITEAALAPLDDAEREQLIALLRRLC